MPVALRVEYSVGNAQGEQATASLSAVFERADAELRDFGKWIFPRLPSVFEQELRTQFGAEGHGPHAGSWAPLSASYEAWKAVRYPGQPILVATGKLREALTDSASPFAARDYSASEFAFGTAGVEYASLHQLGTVRMSARPPFDFGDVFEERLQQEAQLGIVEAVRAADPDSLLEVRP